MDCWFARPGPRLPTGAPLPDRLFSPPVHRWRPGSKIHAHPQVQTARAGPLRKTTHHPVWPVGAFHRHPVPKKLSSLPCMESCMDMANCQIPPSKVGSCGPHVRLSHPALSPLRSDYAYSGFAVICKSSLPLTPHSGLPALRSGHASLAALFSKFATAHSAFWILPNLTTIWARKAANFASTRLLRRSSLPFE